MKHLPITPPLQILVYSLLQRLCCAFIAQRHKFEAIRNKDYSVVKTSKAAKIFSRFFVWAGRKKNSADAEFWGGR